MVGTSGSASERATVVTASARSLPLRMCSIEEGKDIARDMLSTVMAAGYIMFHHHSERTFVSPGNRA
jgi:hypothetical protein